MPAKQKDLEESGNLITRLIRRFITRRRLKIVGVILLIVFVFRSISARRNRPEVSTTKVTKETLVQTVSTSGEVGSTESADLAFAGGGKIAVINVSEGDVVTKGQLLARLDTVKLSADFQKAKHDLADAAASLDKVYDDLQGKEDSETFAEKETRVAAEAAKNKAVEDHIKAEKNLANASIYAPFAGVVTNLESGYTVGTNVLATVKIFSLVNPQTVFFEVEVNETEVINIDKDQEVLIYLDAYPDEEIKSSVQTINFASTTTSTGGTAYNVRVSLPDNQGEKFRLGMNGDANFVVKETYDVLVIDQSAVVEESGESFVWLLLSGKIEKRVVETGSSSIDYVEIVSGLSEGDEVILRPASKLEEGQSVQLAT